MVMAWGERGASRCAIGQSGAVDARIDAETGRMAVQQLRAVTFPKIDQLATAVYQPSTPGTRDWRSENQFPY